MKRTSKIFAMLLVLVMVFSMATVTFAASEYTITINAATDGETYTAYKVLNATGDGTNIAYSMDSATQPLLYVAMTARTDLFELDNISGGTEYNVMQKTDAADADVIAFFKNLDVSALQELNVVKSATASSGTAVIDAGETGYWYITTTLGSTIMLDSTNKTAVINDKHETPGIVKEVKEDSTGLYGKTNTADLQDSVEFKITITKPYNMKNLKLHDSMVQGLEFDATSISIQVNDADVDAANYTLATEGLTDGCDFEIAFTDAYLTTIDAADDIVITYSATVTKDAVIAGDGNPNTATIKYGASADNEKSDMTITYVHQLNLFKHKTDGQPLAGAQFKLSKEEGNTTYYAVVGTDNKLTGWTTDEAGATVFTSPTNGLIVIEGLDAGVYSVTEIAAPTGYNKLKEPIDVTISDTGAFSQDKVIVDTVEYSAVKVLNQTGTEFPTTGGIGTTLFIAFGSLTVVLGGIFLVTNKRMKKAGF